MAAGWSYDAGQSSPSLPSARFTPFASPFLDIEILIPLPARGNMSSDAAQALQAEAAALMELIPTLTKVRYAARKSQIPRCYDRFPLILRANSGEHLHHSV